MKTWFVLRNEHKNSWHLQKQQECQYQQKKVYKKKCFGNLQCNFNVNFREKNWKVKIFACWTVQVDFCSQPTFVCLMSGT
jgi:hypothetical protein